MALILHIETATEVCSVALSRNGELVAEKADTEDYSHAKRLTLLIDELLKEQGLQLKDLDAVSVSSGPGSYTGLRIGLSTAKGLCYALDISLIAISTLKSMAVVMQQESSAFQLLCPMLDARRMEVYTAVYDQNLQELMPPSPLVLDDNSYADYLSKTEVLFAGTGAEKWQNICNNPQAVFFNNFLISAASQASLAYELYQHGITEDIAYFEPDYLKDFQGKKMI